MLLCLIILFATSIFAVASGQTNIQSEDVMTKLADFEERLRKQEKESAAKEELITKHENTIEYQSSKIKALEKQVETYLASKDEMEKINQTIKTLQQRCDHSGQVKRATDGGIAFSAFMNHDQTLGAEQIIIFNKIITNEGNGYNKNSGVFTCPKAGMYLFTFFVGERGRKEGIEQIYAALEMNSQIVMDAVAETRHVTEDAQGGNSVVLRLAQGDTVWISCRVAGYHIEGDISRISTFTGIFLYA